MPHRLDRASTRTAARLARLVPLPDLLLIDEGGRALRPSYPVDDCGFQQIGGTDIVIPVGVDRLIEPDRYSLSGSVCRYTTDNTGTSRFVGAEQLQDSLDNAFDGLLPAPACATVATEAVNTSISFYNLEALTPQPVYIELDGCRRILIADHHPLSATADIITHFS